MTHESGRSMVLLTWGHSNPRTAKTATGLLRFCPQECVAVLDPDHAGRDAAELLGVGQGVPIIGSLSEAPDANTLVIGIAPPGGKVPDSWKPLLIEAMSQGMNLLSGLHEFLIDSDELAHASEQHKVTITDVRKNDFCEIATYPELNPNCLRLLTVGQDCGVGKLVTSLAIAQALQSEGQAAQFIATGQTGIMISGDGLPIDCVTSDFVSGAVESLVCKYQDRDFLLVEGQGSLVHPSYSGVTLSLLHGARPHGLIMVFEAGRTAVGGLDHVDLPSIQDQIQLFETMGSIHQPCHTLALSMNASQIEVGEAKAMAQNLEQELQLPVVDVVREGPKRMLDAIHAFRQKWMTSHT